MLRHNKIHMGYKLTLCSLMLSSTLAYADDQGAVESLTGFNINETSAMKKTGIEVGGWLSMGVAGNFDDPENNSNGPVTFSDRANEFNVQQLYGYVERAVDTESKGWDVGFRADVMYGTDSRFSPTSNYDDNFTTDGNSNYHKVVFPQAYAEIYAPIGNGITTKIGHFYTIIGNEVVTAPDNFFFSHAYTMQYAEPFTHTGILSSYSVNDNVSITGGVVTGWDSFFQQPANFLGGVNYTTDDERTSVAVALVTGDVYEDTARDHDHNRTMYSIVINHDITDNLHYTLHHDFGIEQNAAADGTTAKWYGLNQYLAYDINEKLAVGMRAEWFRDEDGTRVTGAKDHFFALTAGVNYSPVPWLKIRPEVRYDWTSHTTPYDDATDDNQLLISADATIIF